MEVQRQKVKLREVNSYLTCYLCKGYLIDATTISECLHSFCRSCIIKFLQDNSYCPICEVIINKAKPNLKLDKTLQDIVYKLVPELFIKEMTRRKVFYSNYPQLAARLTPEERGEDTERTIYNPQDRISLSMEYISDDSSPGAIKIQNDENKDSLMKRYLQCPGMCRVDVLKKFVRNKYSVDTTKFHIDILHKRVPLPDHYTLIDIAYIYAWKRNEPMKFFFRITDVNKLNERFDHFDSSKADFEFYPIPPVRRRREHTSVKKSVAKKVILQDKSSDKEHLNKSVSVNKEVVNNSASDDLKNNLVQKESVSVKHEEGSINKSANEEVKNNSECVKIKVELTKKEPDKEEISDKELSTPVLLKEEKPCLNSKQDTVGTNNQKTYTNITLNRTEGVEIITKIQQVQNKEGKHIGHQIVQTVRKGNPNNKIAIPKLPRKIVPTKEKSNLPDVVPSNIKTNLKSVKNEIPRENNPYEEEKCKFLKLVELTAKKNNELSQKRKESSTSSSSCCTQIKDEQMPYKKNKIEKKGTAKIIITHKNETKRDSGLQSLIDSCKINIPSSLSITIKESSENMLQTPIPPVKNYIEILKLPDEEVKTQSNSRLFCDNDSEQKVDQDIAEIAKSLTEKIPLSTSISQIVGPKHNFPIPVQNVIPKFPILPSPVPELSIKCTKNDSKEVKGVKTSSTFQKIFEESIKKPLESSPTKAESEQNIGSTKRNLEVANCPLIVPKKTKVEDDSKSESNDTQSVTVSNLHSTTLGLNYSVSVSPKSPTKNKANGTISPIKIEEKSRSSSNESVTLSPVLKSRYNHLPVVQRYANISPKPVSPKVATMSPKLETVSPKLGTMSPKNMPKSAPISPKSVKKVAIPSKAPKLKPKSPKIDTKVKVKPPALSPKITKLVSISPKPTNVVNTSELLEKYKIQNLAQLTASLNLSSANFGVNSNGQLAALQHAMLLKHIEIQNRQNWLNMNQGPLLQYEKYLQSLNGGQNHLLGNTLKEN